MRKCANRQALSFKQTIACGLAVFVAGCTASKPITNLERVSAGQSYQAEYQSRENKENRKYSPVVDVMNFEKCLEEASPTPNPKLAADREVLSTGDLVDVSIANDETFSGKYEISQDGTLKLRGLPSIPAFGRTTTEIESSVAGAMKLAKFYDLAPHISVRLTDFGVVRAFVSGAVFEAGAITLGGSAANSADNSRVQALGAVTEGRRLSRALQSAGGIRPDADISRVSLKRGAVTRILDLRGAITGQPFDDALILQGDQIHIPSRNCFQKDLMVPSVVTPPGTKVFMSNLTEPATNNAVSAINKDTRELRYGTRFMQAVIGMNCVGGSKLSNASRSAVLYTHNPVTGKSIVIERRVEDMVRNADRDEFDPYILPNDSLACYDSNVTDVVKIAQAFGIVGASIIVGRGL